MLVRATLILIEGDSFGGATTHSVSFGSLGEARSEYERLTKILAEKTGNGGKVVEVVGLTTNVSFFGNSLKSVTLHDFAAENDAHEGIADAFPNMFVKRVKPSAPKEIADAERAAVQQEANEQQAKEEREGA